MGKKQKALEQRVLKYIEALLPDWDVALQYCENGRARLTAVSPYRGSIYDHFRLVVDRVPEFDTQLTHRDFVVREFWAIVQYCGVTNGIGKALEIRIQDGRIAITLDHNDPDDDLGYAAESIDSNEDKPNYAEFCAWINARASERSDAPNTESDHECCLSESQATALMKAVIQLNKKNIAPFISRAVFKIGEFKVDHELGRGSISIETEDGRLEQYRDFDEFVNVYELERVHEFSYRF